MPPDTVWVEADLDSIDQVMENLIDNAVKYTFAENKLVTVVVEQFADHVQVVVEDKGDGIPGQDIPVFLNGFTEWIKPDVGDRAEAAWVWLS